MKEKASECSFLVSANKEIGKHAPLFYTTFKDKVI
jgi:hypothetical protein